MKMTISQVLVRHAVDYLRTARERHKEGYLDEVVVACIGAQLTMAIALEGVANEIADAIFAGWVVERFEQIPPQLKWYILSGWDGRTAFDQSGEPLQTVGKLV